MTEYKVGDIAYLVESNKYVSEGKVISVRGGLISFMFIGRKGGMRVSASRLFPSEEAAFASIRKSRHVSPQHLRAVMA